MQFNGIIFPQPKSSYDSSTFFGRMLYIPRNHEEWELDIPKISSDKAYKTLKEKGSIANKSAGFYSSPCIPCLYLSSKKPSSKILIFFHGNAEDVGSSRHLLKMMRRIFPLHMIAMEYQGYGIYPGKASAISIVEDGEILISYLKNVLHFQYSDIIVFGRSVGSGPSCYFASKYSIHSLILMSPFTSLRAAAKVFVGSVLQYLVAERFNNKECISKVKAPIFLIHGLKDTIVPYTQSAELWKNITSPSVFHLPPNMDHSRFSFFNDFVKPLKNFYDTLELDTTPIAPNTGLLQIHLRAFNYPESQ